MVVKEIALFILFWKEKIRSWLCVWCAAGCWRVTLYVGQKWFLSCVSSWALSEESSRDRRGSVVLINSSVVSFCCFRWPEISSQKILWSYLLDCISPLMFNQLNPMIAAVKHFICKQYGPLWPQKVWQFEDFPS